MDAITKAKGQLVMSFPFWGRLAFQPTYVADPTIETAGTNGIEIRYNPEYVASLTNAEVQGLLAHEIGHNAFGHIFRIAGRDHEEFNVAADYSLNGILKAAGITLPAGALYDPQYDGMSAEQIYGIRQGQAKQQNDGNQPGPAKPGDGDQKHDFGGCGEFTEAGAGAADHLSEVDRAALEQEWRIAVEQAAQAEKACGEMGEDLERAINKLRQPIVDWRSVLADFIDSCVQRRYSWTKPNRRFIGSGIYLPSLIADGVGEIAICVDTSGSVSDAEVEQYASEIFDIIEAVRPEKVTVVYCHHKVTNTETFTHDDPPDRLQPVGSGGTKFSPAFDWVNENIEDPVCLIYLTDLESHDWPDEQDYPVLWVSTNYDPETVAPIGETIHMGSIH